MLIATISTTDIQVVYDDDSRLKRLRLKRKSVRAFHQACIDGAFDTRVLPLEQSLRSHLERFDEKDYAYDAATKRLAADISDTDMNDYAIDCAASGVTLCAPLLAETWELMQHSPLQSRLGAARAVLLLTTNRDEGDFREQEPIAAFSLLRSVIANQFGLNGATVIECEFLKRAENLYQADAFGQRHLRMIAARRIDEAIQTLCREHPGCIALVSDVGGLPEPKAVIAASVRYRFGGKLRVVRRPEKDEAVPAATAVILPPAESLVTRMQVANLVQIGAFDAAARLASSLGERYERGEPWRRWLRAVASVFDGDRSALEEIQLEEDSAMRAATQRILSGGPVLLSAFRIESSLRRGNWVWALRETFTCFEIARDSIIDRSFRTKGQSCLDPSRMRLLFRNVEANVKGRILSECHSEDELSLFALEYTQWLRALTDEVRTRIKRAAKHRRDFVTFRLGESRDCFDSENERLDAIEGVDLCFYLQAAAYDGLLQLLSDTARDAIVAFGAAIERVRPIRNLSTHAPLSAAKINEARQSLCQTGVWSRHDWRFLASPPVVQMLNSLSLNPKQSRSLYDSLVAAIIEDMDTNSFKD
ncbi:MAG: hypothetical protein ACC645_05375 [Pirellulales bacterium]